MRRLLLLTALLLGVIALAVSNALRDTTPPVLSVDAPPEVPAGLPFDLEVSADEPVTVLLSYGVASVQAEAVSADGDAPRYRASLLAEEGTQTVMITATDAADNAAEEVVSVTGIGPLAPDISLPGALIPGEPFTVSTTWAAEGPQAVSVEVEVGGEAQRVVALEGVSVALGKVPLGTPEGELDVSITLTDEYGRAVNETRVLEVLAYPQPVEELNLSGSVLSVITPEGREQERQMIEGAYERIDEVLEPTWAEPFILPIQGRNTSGFGSPRRYAAGGNVSYHNGADIAAPTGTPILATNAGRVLVAGFYPIKGGFTLIDHGAGLYSYYLHQSALHVKAVQEVARGQHIGDVGSTGLSTGPHLHWEMRLDGAATNPLSWVGKVRP